MRKRRLPVETDLIPYAPGFPPGRRWLVLAPHADDEVFGAGATIALGIRRGVEIHLVVATDGGAQGSPVEREREARAAAAALGLPEPEFWRFPDRSLHPDDRSLRGRLKATVDRRRPEVVFVTSPVELHPDHRALAAAVQRVVRALSFRGLWRRGPGWVAAYEVATQFRPNLLVAADEAWESKKAAGACYASQNAVRPYDRLAEAQATLRALTLDGIQRAEAFHIEPAGRVARLSARRWATLMGAPPDMARRG